MCFLLLKENDFYLFEFEGLVSEPIYFVIQK